MSNLALAILAGLSTGGILMVMMRSLFAQPTWQRSNYRGHLLPVGVGLVFVFSPLIIEACISFSAELLDDAIQAMDRPRASTLITAISLGLLGLIDDLVDSGEIKGFRGHLREAFKGRLTTGGLKLFGGGFVALVVCAPYVETTRFSSLQLIADASLVAFSANLANLFDRGPGRVIKVSIFAFSLLAVMTSFDETLVGPTFILGASLSLLWGDLREQFMLGDTGANVLGGVIGLSIVMSCTPWIRACAAVLALVLNVVSERVSFSAVIDRFGPLRALDHLGRHTGP